MADEGPLVLHKVEEGEAPGDPWKPRTRADAARIHDAAGFGGDYREHVLGFGRTVVAAGTFATITRQTMVPFRPYRLIIPSDVALDFMLCDLKIGKDSQLNSMDELPASVFSEQSIGIKLRGDVCHITMQASIVVRNISGADRPFTAALVGPVVE